MRWTYISLAAALLAAGCVDLTEPTVLATERADARRTGADVADNSGSIDQAAGGDGDAAAGDAPASEGGGLSADAQFDGPLDAGASDAGLADVDPGADVAPADGGTADLAAPPPVDAAVDAAIAAPDLGPLDGGADQGADGTSDGQAEAPAAPRLLLHWAFDEALGTSAVDSSGNNLTGTYAGVAGIPQPVASSKAPTQFTNARSRAFTRVNRHHARLPGIPTALRQASEFTVSLWYRATSLDTQGAELLTAGDSWSIRLKPGGEIHFLRVLGGPGGGTVAANCRAPVLDYLDGDWHHLAATSTASGSAVYVDGSVRCQQNLAGPVQYSAGPDLWVGRQNSGATGLDFEGNLDEIRLYTGLLPTADLQAIAAGQR